MPFAIAPLYLLNVGTTPVKEASPHGGDGSRGSLSGSLDFEKAAREGGLSRKGGPDALAPMEG